MLKGEVLPKAPVDFLSTMQPLDIVKTPKGVGTHFALRRLPLISAKIRKKRPTVRDFTGMIRELLPVAGGFPRPPCGEWRKSPQYVPLVR
jgi:hypothetical protein